MSGDLLVITPVRNESAHLSRVVEAVARQTRPPERWIIADDGSDDGTIDILRAAEREIEFMRVVEIPQRPGGAADRLALAAEARAFNVALAEAGSGFDLIGKLDGDIVLAPNHFERLAAAFDADPSLGVAGCLLEEEDEDGEWRVNRIPPWHVHGAVKLYRRACLDAIGGMPERLGWDTLDETHARMLGWTTRTLPDLRARHLRRSASVGGVLRGKARHGECAWICAYPPEIVLARSALLMIRERPRPLAGAAFLAGFTRAAMRRRGRPEDRELLRFSRAEQRRRVRGRLAR